MACYLVKIDELRLENGNRFFQVGYLISESINAFTFPC